MKLLFLDINQSQNVSTISKLNTYQQIGIATAFKNIGYDVSIGVFNNIDYSPLKMFDMNTANDLNEFSIIFLTNFELNFFAGKEVKSYADSFRLLHSYTGKIVYLLSDLHMEFDQYQKRHAKRFNYNLSDLYISTEIINAVHTFDIDNTKKSFRRPLDKLYYFPIQYSTFYKKRNKLTKNYFDLFKTEKEYDLVYCGSWRGGRREKKMKEYFFDNSLKTLIFGPLKIENFENFTYNSSPTFIGKLPFDEISIYNQKAHATIIFGDTQYNNNFFTTRILEALRDDLILFIDNEYDQNHKLGFSDFHYVSNIKELQQKIIEIKSNNKLYMELLDEQHKYYNKYTDKYFEDCCKKLIHDIIGKEGK